MTLMDLFRPRWRHSDAKVRLAAVSKATSQKILDRVARSDPDDEVRLGAVRKLVNPATLAEIAKTDNTSQVRLAALEVCVDLDQIEGVVLLGDIAENATNADVRARASELMASGEFLDPDSEALLDPHAIFHNPTENFDDCRHGPFENFESAPALNLRVHSAEGSNRTLDFRQEVLTIGRNPNADVPILEPAASRQHAMLQHLPSGFWELVDLGSDNGTKVNDELVRRALVVPGDTICIGATMITADYEAPAQQAESTQPPFRAYRGDEPYIFVSYSHQDRARVFEEIARLHRGGYRIWYDEGIHPGAAWADSIGDLLQKASFCLAFVSHASAASKNCEDEIFFAVDESIPWVLVHLEPTELRSGLRLRTARVQAIHRYEMDERRYHRKLSEVLPAETRRRSAADPHELEPPADSGPRRS
jgi:hypothetical protein